MTETLVIAIRVYVEPFARRCCMQGGSRHERAVQPSAKPRMDPKEGVHALAKVQV